MEFFCCTMSSLLLTVMRCGGFNGFLELSRCWVLNLYKLEFRNGIIEYGSTTFVLGHVLFVKGYFFINLRFF